MHCHSIDVSHWLVLHGSICSRLRWLMHHGRRLSDIQWFSFTRLVGQVKCEYLSITMR